jgi:hypothetical protein
MKQYHGNIAARSLLPWRYGGPLIVAMWTYDMDIGSITVFAAEQDAPTCRICVYVVEPRGCVVNISTLLSAVSSLSYTWSTGYSISATDYVVTMHHIQANRGFFYIPKITPLLWTVDCTTC